MVETIELAAQKREVTGKQVRGLRSEGMVPAVVYGHGIEAETLSVGLRTLTKVYDEAGSNKIVSLSVDDAKPFNVMIHDIQKDARKGVITHADFYKVKMDEKIKAEVPLTIIGESTAVYKLEGSLIQPLATVEVEALPANLPETIEVDISVLDDFDKAIHVSDLPIPTNVELLTDEHELVAKVDAPRSDEELEELDEAIVEDIPGEDGEVAEGETAESAEDGAAKDEATD